MIHNKKRLRLKIENKQQSGGHLVIPSGLVIIYNKIHWKQTYKSKQVYSFLSILLLLFDDIYTI